MVKTFIIVLFTVVSLNWAASKPMESIENYNVMLIHGAYGSQKGFSADTSLPEAYNAGGALENGATLGGYTNDERITQWLSSEIFEETGWKDNKEYVHNSYVFNWRSFSKPANSSVNNARELGYRQWNGDGTYGKRRALVEEAQEVKASLKVNRNGQDSLYTGQAALDTIRKNPDLYRQIASRYILIGHSMGGVASREYVQNSDYYHGDVDKIITLDSPHERIGALNMQVAKEARTNLGKNAKKNLLKQRFYYLFKAYVSALDYQGFRVRSAKDGISRHECRRQGYFQCRVCLEAENLSSCRRCLPLGRGYRREQQCKGFQQDRQLRGAFQGGPHGPGVHAHVGCDDEP